MNPPCARCSKTVYPMEKLNCLDKYWHKGCFSCEACNMKLTMKNYKGYNKKPYCNAHYPTTKFTAVADTPENLRLAKNTNQQSNVVYHKDFETAKGQYTAVTDDPESQRLKKVTNMSSQIAYKSALNAPGQPGGAGRLPPQQQQQQHHQQRRYDDYPAEPPSQYEEEYPQEPALPYEEEYPEEPAPPPSMPAMPPQMVPDQRPPPPMPSSGPQYVAMYDYSAADDDEVSFVEGDIIVNTEEIDAGWMSGTVQRTGDTGMLPSNYVQPC